MSSYTLGCKKIKFKKKISLPPPVPEKMALKVQIPAVFLQELLFSCRKLSITAVIPAGKFGPAVITAVIFIEFFPAVIFCILFILNFLQ